MTKDQARKFFKQHGIQFILAQFVDIHGAAKSKAVPVEHLDMVLTDGAGFAGFAMWGFGMEPNSQDYMAVGDLSTLAPMSWMPGFARMACDGHVKGQPYEYCSRVMLKRNLDALAKKGMTLYTGIEPEFFLLKRDGAGKLVPVDATDNLDKPCYDYKGLSRQAEFLQRVVDGGRKGGLDIYQIDHEDGNGQFEVNFTYADALKSADNLTFFKMAASEVAHQMGMIATFMPKPFSDRAGTGAHFHLSLGDRKTKNLFLDKSDKHGLGLSQMGYWFTGGILAHARALAAICAPTVNSYKRLVVGRALSGATWAPAYVSYGDNNRTACVRIPYGRLEFRLPDGGCNPYLATAALLAAGMDGIARKLDPGAPNNENLYEWSPEKLKKSGITLLPQNLGEAIQALEGDTVIRDALGANLFNEYIKLKRMEWVEYSRHVSVWEQTRYLEFF